MKNKRYWMCIVGPTDVHKLPQGADNPMRKAVKGAFEKLTEHEYHDCYSGWGMSERRKDAVMKVWNMEEDDL